MTTGKDVYNHLMDLALLLADIGPMFDIHRVLHSIPDDNEGLKQFDDEILNFINRLERIAGRGKQL